MDKTLFSLPEIEQWVLDYWRENSTFQKTVEARKNGEPFVFYDGPPFSTGLPHYGHILQMAIKDAVLRYKTMQGYNVPRKIGWDTHGLPVEYELEKELKLSGKRQIEEYGIDNFVEAARGIVLRYTTEWQKTMERMGRWVDITHPYTTMDNTYIESVWWAFSQLYKKNLIYKDFRVSPYCPRCGTVLSNFEVNQGYKDNISDPSVFVALELESGNEELANAYLIIWTTTPWTLPANAAVAVNPNETYSLIEKDDRLFVIHSQLIKNVFSDQNYTVIKEIPGSNLIGLRYRQLYLQHFSTQPNEAYKIVAGHHVSIEEGTGLVHIAPAYGEDDFVIGRENKLPLLQTVEKDGTVSTGKNIPGEGEFVKEADRAIIADLESRDLLVKEQKIKHTYPFCWRCDTPLLYFPATSWYVKVTELRDELITENKKINWLPEHLRDGRFGRWLEGARDWAISRDRYWGAPLPVWECKNDAHGRVIIGSIDELKRHTQDVPNDLHRPYIDSVTMKCPDCHEEMRRVPFVFDCWFESGSMPYAQHHYPFENQEKFNPESEEGYPADFIAEALDQTRGWFYTMHVLGVALFGEKAYKNVVTSGLILAPDGKKLSKSLRNYTDPELLMNEQGVDALRLFLFTATTLGEDYRFSDAGVQDVKRRWIVPLLNVIHYYKLSLKESDNSSQTEEHHAMLDDWIKARVAEARHQVFEAMEGGANRSPYDLVRACRTFGPLIEDLSTWYVRLSRGRKDAAFSDTLQQVLIKISTTFASFLPFLSEYIYQEVRNPDPKFPESVHLCTLKKLDDWQNHDVLAEMAMVAGAVSVLRDIRAKNNIPNRQTLNKIEMKTTSEDASRISSAGLQIIAQELQVEQVEIVDKITESFEKGEYGPFEVGLDITITRELKNKGLANTLRRSIQDLRKQAGLHAGDIAKATVSGISQEVHVLLEKQLPNTELVTSPTEEKIGQSEIAGEVDSLIITLYK